jgi:RHS repeat-associated protein
VADPENNVTRATYDSLGRMFELVSPDAGRTEWRFDLAGNIGAKITARLDALGHQIRYEYDFSRLTKIDYPDITDVVYEYGGPEESGDENGNLAGRIKHEESQAGTRDYLYDWMGNVAQDSSSVPNVRNPSHGNYAATMLYEYDSFGRIQSMVFPGGGAEKVTYQYDHGGRIQKIVGDNTEVDPAQPSANPHTDYLQHVGYDEFEQKTRVVHGNGITTRYTYTPEMRRLHTIDAASRDTFLQQANLPARPFQKMTYVYDDVGNITQVRNDAPLDDRPNASVHIGTTTYDYQYDRANQLRRSTAVMTEQSAFQFRHSLEYTYDEIGNIATKTQRADVLTKRRGVYVFDHTNNDQSYSNVYAYGSTRPHAPTHLDETIPSKKTYPRDITYDESGNQTGWVYKNAERRKINWDSEDRISSVEHNGETITEALYDASGQRTNYVAEGQETITLNQYVTARSAQQSAYLTKHIYADGMRVADKVQASWLAPTPFYYHPDHLGSTHYVSDRNQDLVQHEEYFASGEPWTDEIDTRFLFHHFVTFTGATRDDSTGYYYLGARYYDPRINVWNSTDPAIAAFFSEGIADPRQLGLYTYAHNDPVGRFDPSGLEDLPVNFAPPGAKPGARFFLGGKGKGTQHFSSDAELEAAAGGRQIYRYDPDKGFDLETATTIAELRAAMRGEDNSGLKDALIAAAFVNAETPDAIKTDGSGSAKGVPGGRCTTCKGSTAAQAAYLGATAAAAGVGVAISTVRKAAQKGASKIIARIAPGSLPAAEEAAVLATLKHIDDGTKPAGALAKKWGTKFKNKAGDLPGSKGPASPYKEYRVAPSAGQTGAGPNRIVVNTKTGEMYYTWTHYGDSGQPAFVQIR